MKHLIRHGTRDPNTDDLDNRQLGLSESSLKLWTKLNDTMVCLNDYSSQPLEDEEIRTYRFQGAGSSVTEDLYAIEGLRIQVARTGGVVSKLSLLGDAVEVLPIIGAEPSAGPAENQWTIAIGSQTYAEYVLTISQSYSLRLSYYHVSDSQAMITLESLVFTTDGTVTL